MYPTCTCIYDVLCISVLRPNPGVSQLHKSVRMLWRTYTYEQSIKTSILEHSVRILRLTDAILFLSVFA